MTDRAGRVSASEYYVMSCEGVFPGTTIGTEPALPRGAWMTGQLITYPVPEPLVYALDPDYPGLLQPMYKAAAPLMRDDLCTALGDAGVDNLQLFSAVLRDTQGVEHQSFKAVNIVGVVSAADLAQSTMMGTTDSTLIDADFHALVFKKSAPKDLLLFRLAEAVNAIVVHERVRRVIEERAIPGMTFFSSGEWSG
jgi:hypothetical protein